MDNAGRDSPVKHTVDSGERRVARYDARLAHLRLALIEQQVTLARALKKRDEILQRQAAWADSGGYWEESRLQVEREIADAERSINELTPQVGNPEEVVDEQGWLPRERRERFLDEFAAKINTEISELHQRLPRLRAELKVTRGRRERAPIREELNKGTARLAYLEGVGPFSASDMCSECPSPMAWHDTAVTFCLVTGAILSEPCRSWPVWRQNLLAGLLSVAEMLQRKKERPPKQPPQPLAVIASGASLEAAIAQLTAVQAKHPNAQVRRSEQNDWEIWPEPGPE